MKFNLKTIYSKVSSENETSDRLAFIVLISLSLLYLFLAVKYTYNLPKAQDDVKIFLIHFNKLISEGKQSASFIDYLFFLNKTHIKLDARLITLICYLFFKSINFKFILIAGHSLLIASVFLLRSIFNRIPTVFFLFAIIPFLTPSSYIWSWSVGVWGYVSHLFILSLIAYFISKEKVTLASAACVFSTFTMGSGFLAFLFAIPSLVISENKKRSFLIWAFSASIAMAAFVFIITSQNSGLSKTEGISFQFFNAFNYTVNFLANSLFIESGLFDTRSVIIIGYGIIVASLTFFIRLKRNIDSSGLIALSLIMILFLNGFISSFFRGDASDGFYVTVPNRYEIFSKYFYSILILGLFSLSYLKLKTLNVFVKYSAIVFSILLYGLNFYPSHERMTIYGDRAKVKLLNSIAENKTPKSYRINYFIDKDLYQPPSSIDQYNESYRIQLTKAKDQLNLQNKLFQTDLKNNIVFVTGMIDLDPGSEEHNIKLSINPEEVIDCQKHSFESLPNSKYIRNHKRSKRKKDVDMVYYSCIDYRHDRDNFTYIEPKVILTHEDTLVSSILISPGKQIK